MPLHKTSHAFSRVGKIDESIPLLKESYSVLTIIIDSNIIIFEEKKKEKYSRTKLKLQGKL